MKTLHLETGRHLYGGPRQVLLLLDGLRKRGIDATLACPTDSAIAGAAEAAGHHVITHAIGGDLDVSAISFLTRTVQRLKPDLLHAHSRRGADFFGGLAATLARVPAMLTRRVDNPDTPVVGTPQVPGLRPGRGHLRRRPRPSSRTRACPPAKLRTIRSASTRTPASPPGPGSSFLAEFGLEPGNRIVAVVAQLIPRKGHALLLEAWLLIHKRCPDARLLIFGAGPLRPTSRPARGRGPSRPHGPGRPRWPAPSPSPASAPTCGSSWAGSTCSSTRPSGRAWASACWRPRRPGSPWSPSPPVACPRRWPTATPACSSSPAMPPPWRRPSSCCWTTPTGAASWAPPPPRGSGRTSARTAMVEAYIDLYREVLGDHERRRPDGPA